MTNRHVSNTVTNECSGRERTSLDALRLTKRIILYVPVARRSLVFPTLLNAALAGHLGQDNMAAAAGRYFGEGGRATKRQKTEEGGMTTVRVSLVSR